MNFLIADLVRGVPVSRRSIPLLILIILSLQSILIISTHSPDTLGTSDSPAIATSMTPSQGSRLDSDDYSNHVPFTIDEIGDFGLLGFPGTGTQNDPYVISSLNITANFDLTSIRVINIDAYFTIVDCFLKQDSPVVYGIELINTSHATIEHVTVDSVAGGIYCENANNTMFNSSHVFAAEHALYLYNSTSCIISNNFLEGGIYPFLAIGCNAFRSENNMLQAVGSIGCMIIEQSNSSRSNSDQFNTTHWATKVNLSNNFTITDAIIDSVWSGISLTNSQSPTVERCSILSENDYGISVLNCPNVTINESTIVTPYGSGITIEDSNYTRILDNSIQVDLYGILVSSSFQAVADGNVVEQGLVGIFFTYCEQSLITSNDISGSWLGGGMQWCDNSFITHNYLYNTEIGGIGSNDNFNITINDNTMNGTGRGGISLHAEDLVYGVEICRNQITNITWYAIQVSDHSDIVINNNIISNLEGDTLWWDEGMGIRLAECDNVEIEGNHISDATTGMGIASVVNLSIESNTIEEMVLRGIGGVNNVNSNITDNIVENCEMGGISLGMLVDTGQRYRGPPSGTISGNNLSGCGFVTNFDTFSQFEAHTYADNTVNSKPLYYGSNISNLEIDASIYGQIIIFNSTDLNITNHDYVFDNTMTHILFSSRILADGIIARTPYTSFFVYGSQNINVDNFEGDYLEIHPKYVDFGVHFYSFLVSQSSGVLIENSVLTGNNENVGIGLMDSLQSTVMNCEINNMYIGIYHEDSSSSTISENIITDTQYGVRFMGFGASVNNNVTLNEIRHGYIAGVFIDSNTADSGLIEGNVIENCGNGIQLEDGDFWRIQNNSIRWNYDYGIYLIGSTGTNVTYNILGFSGTENGYDNVARNWDDNVSLGNYWYDYTPPGVYPISGGAGAQDRYPMQYLVTEPIADRPLDVDYAEGSEGNNLTWNPADDALRDWQVTIDGVFWDAEAYNYENVTVNIDGLAYGTHTLVITIWDVDQNNVTDEVIIYVYDATPPTINHPANAEVFVDVEGKTHTWDVDDANPDVYELYLDDELVETGNWTSGLLEVSIDGQDAGVHVFMMMVYDVDGNVANDSVSIVYIDDDIAPILDSPDDLTIDYGAVGDSIVWTPIDEYPDQYSIVENESTIVSGNWAGSRIILSLDNLEVGIYDFELTVVDGTGLSATDTVRVTVQRIATVTTPLPPLDLGLAMIVGVTAGAICIVIIAVLLIKNRKTP